MSVDNNKEIEWQAEIIYNYIKEICANEKIGPNSEKIKCDLENDERFSKIDFDAAITLLEDSGKISVKKTISGIEKFYNLDLLLENHEKHIAIAKKIYDFLDSEWGRWHFPSVSNVKKNLLNDTISMYEFEIAFSYLREKALIIGCYDKDKALKLFPPFTSKLECKKFNYLF